MLRPVLAAALASSLGCGDNLTLQRDDHGPIAQEIVGPLGSPLPTATAEQLEAFERGREVSLHRFSLSEGLGPTFNVTFCGACHEKPTQGGAAGLYRNFSLAGLQLEDGPFVMGNPVSIFTCGDERTAPQDRERTPPEEASAGVFAGVMRMYSHALDQTARPDPGTDLNVIAQRNPIPFFGVGLLAELSEEEILKRSDPDDRNGDGISGRPNYDTSGDRVFVGRFGLKAQTVSIEGFIRGPLFNHLGITSDPLLDEDRARLPVDSSSPDGATASRWIQSALRRYAQAAAPSSPNCDLDDVMDPELEPHELFDLVSFAMLLAAPEPEPLNDQRRRGLKVFDALGCDGCHTPRLEGPRGPVHAYSDLLLHDMGPVLADGIRMGEATGSEFRTQPLWGITAVGPYLHDGRASTIDEAIRMHGGEGQRSADGYVGLGPQDRADLEEFLMSLGGRAQSSKGLIAPDETRPAEGEIGGPLASLSNGQVERFWAGRELFDHEFGLSAGVGAPRMNGDSCRACHFEPVVGGAGPRGVNVMRHGIVAGGEFVAPLVGTILHKQTSALQTAIFPQPDVTVFEHRQTPALFGLGLIETIDDADIIVHADPDDLDGDGVSGRESRVDGGRLGRLGWKAQVPGLREFVRDAAAAELGMTLPEQDGLTFGRSADDDLIPDPELSLEQADLLFEYMRNLAPPPRRMAEDREAAAAGEALFESVGCSKCHVPELPGAQGPVRLYSDLLLHEVVAQDRYGIEDSSANMWEFRTAPLWGVSQTAPYLHSGQADTLDEAIRAHDGEAGTIRGAYEALSDSQRAQLIQFLETL